MKPRHLFPYLYLALALATASAHAAKGHVHGAGTLDVSIDKGRISLMLELPLAAATGFEHAPKTPKERAALENAENLLKDAATLFVPSRAAECALKSAKVTLPFSADKNGAANSNHADIEAEYLTTDETGQVPDFNIADALRAAGFDGISLFYAAFTFRGWVAYAA